MLLLLVVVISQPLIPPLRPRLLSTGEALRQYNLVTFRLILTNFVISVPVSSHFRFFLPVCSPYSPRILLFLPVQSPYCNRTYFSFPYPFFPSRIRFFLLARNTQVYPKTPPQWNTVYLAWIKSIIKITSILRLDCLTSHKHLLVSQVLNHISSFKT